MTMSDEAACSDHLREALDIMVTLHSAAVETPHAIFFLSSSLTHLPHAGVSAKSKRKRDDKSSCRHLLGSSVLASGERVPPLSPSPHGAVWPVPASVDGWAMSPPSGQTGK